MTPSSPYRPGDMPGPGMTGGGGWRDRGPPTSHWSDLVSGGELQQVVRELEAQPRHLGVRLPG